MAKCNRNVHRRYPKKIKPKNDLYLVIVFIVQKLGAHSNGVQVLFLYMI